MKRFFLAGMVCLALAAGIFGAAAQSNVTVHAQQSFREGEEIVRFSHFDVSLDARLITADEALYSPNTGDTELRGNVVAHLAAPAGQYPFDLFAMEFHPEGDIVRLTQFNVKLDGRTLSGDAGTYEPKAGVLTPVGNVHLVLPPHLNNKMAPETVH